MTYKKALEFAEFHHRGQVRKYTNTPYILHPIRVANRVRDYFHKDSYQVQAAILHDTIEDCKNVDYNNIALEFGTKVAELVLELTSHSKQDKEVGKKNRKERKIADREYLSKVSNDAKIIKACDRIDNLMELPEEEAGGFYYKYLEESKLLYEVISQPDLPRELDIEFRKLIGLEIYYRYGLD